MYWGQILIISISIIQMLFFLELFISGEVGERSCRNPQWTVPDTVVSIFCLMFGLFITALPILGGIMILNANVNSDVEFGRKKYREFIKESKSFKLSCVCLLAVLSFNLIWFL